MGQDCRAPILSTAYLFDPFLPLWKEVGDALVKFGIFLAALDALLLPPILRLTRSAYYVLTMSLDNL